MSIFWLVVISGHCCCRNIMALITDGDIAAATAATFAGEVASVVGKGGALSTGALPSVLQRGALATTPAPVLIVGVATAAAAVAAVGGVSGSGVVFVDGVEGDVDVVPLELLVVVDIKGVACTLNLDAADADSLSSADAEPFAPMSTVGRSCDCGCGCDAYGA